MKDKAIEGLQPLYSSTIEDTATRQDFLEAVASDLFDDTEEGFKKYSDYVDSTDLFELFSQYLSEEDEIRVIQKQLKKQGINNLVIAYLTRFGDEICFVGTNGESGSIKAIREDHKYIGIHLSGINTFSFWGANSNLKELAKLEEAFREVTQVIDDTRVQAAIRASSGWLRHSILYNGDMVNYLLDWADSSDDASVSLAIVNFIGAIIDPF